MSFRDRLDTLSRGEIAGLIVVLVAVLGGAGLWYARSLPKPVTIAQAGSGAPVGSVSPSPAVTLIVDVAGEVKQPGVYEFTEGDRVIDAIERAGGQLPRADLSLLNLAAPLTDGTQILVPKSGPPGAVVPGGGTTGSSTGLININSASATELETLSGIGEVLAATIIEYREQNGPFATVEELMDVSGIGPATLEEIRDQVTV
ncbi:MAG: ComEA family DNA-binding protein [Actinomycetia bacterium]|jgi:competence protein ComEA|nr:ComEA family DNA-binding protein [Actinomycetes bacterium]